MNTVARTTLVLAWLAFAGFGVWLWVIKAIPAQALIGFVLITAAAIALALIPGRQLAKDPFVGPWLAEMRSFHWWYYVLVVCSWTLYFLPSAIAEFPYEYWMAANALVFAYAVWQLVFGKDPGYWGVSWRAAICLWIGIGIVLGLPWIAVHTFFVA